MVSSICITFMVLSLIYSVLVPIVGAIYGKKILGGTLRVFFLGCIFFFISVVVLESFAHSIILSSIPSIRTNTFILAIYGGLMAGLFEETARLCAFKFFCKNKMANDKEGIMYGVGHGTFEAFYLLFSGMISNIIMSVMINRGTTNLLTDTLPAESASAIQTSIDTLISTPFYMYLLGMYERIPAIAVHISLSVLVWFAVKNNKNIYYVLAILLHLLLDAVSVILSAYANTFVVELGITAVSVLIVLIAVNIYKLNLPLSKWRFSKY